MVFVLEDIMLLPQSVTVMQKMLDICPVCGYEFDIKFEAVKLAARH